MSFEHVDVSPVPGWNVGPNRFYRILQVKVDLILLEVIQKKTPLDEVFRTRLYLVFAPVSLDVHIFL